ncbi:MAG TPA: hypothetical protein PLK80_15485 [bacterium]|nr:hypothetical protein [bacterium]
MKKVISALIFVAAISSAAAAGPWVQEKGRSQFALTTAYTHFNTFLNAEGNEKDLDDHARRLEFLAYYNAGLGNKSDISVLAGYSITSSRDPIPGVTQHRIRGISDLNVRYKKQIHNKHSAIALMAGVRIPGSYDEQYLNSPGDGSFDVEAGASFGEYYRERNFYYSADAIYRVRTGSTPDEVEVDLEIGRVFADVWLARALVTRISCTDGYSTSHTALGTAPTKVSSFSYLNKDKVRIGAGLTRQTGRLSSIGFTVMQTATGSNAPKDRSYYLTYSVQNK